MLSALHFCALVNADHVLQAEEHECLQAWSPRLICALRLPWHTPAAYSKREQELDI
jgi:hypothetical protein